MAIFGDLADLPFPEIFNMVGRRTGRLQIFGVPYLPNIDLDLEDGKLRGVRMGEEPIDDPLQVRDRLAPLMEAPRGIFEFQRCGPEALQGSLQMPITSLLMAIASAVDEISAYRERFAHPETRFKILASEEVWLDEDLWMFLERATPMLMQGSDASELARALHVSVEQVQLHLYKLRSVGRVAPVRAFEEFDESALFGAGPAAGAHHTTFDADLDAALDAAFAPASEPAFAPPPHSSNGSHARGTETISRLLRSLKDRLGASIRSHGFWGKSTL